MKATKNCRTPKSCARSYIFSQPPKGVLESIAFPAHPSGVHFLQILGPQSTSLGSVIWTNRHHTLRAWHFSQLLRNQWCQLKKIYISSEKVVKYHLSLRERTRVWTFEGSTDTVLVCLTYILVIHSVSVSVTVSSVRSMLS